MTGPAITEEKQETTVEQEKTEPTPLFLHPDDAELAELERLAAEEEAQAKPEEQQTGETAQEPKPQPATHMIPKARLDEVLRHGGELQARLDQLAQQNAFLAGQLEAMGRTTTSPPDPQQSADPVAEVKARLFALGDRYDQGELSMREFLEQRDALDAELVQARAEASRPTPEQFQVTVNRDPVVASHLNRLQSQNPWFANVPQEHVQEFLVPRARELLERQGVIIEADAQSTMILREAVVDLARNFGMDLKYGGAQSPQPAPRPQPTGVTPQERAAKVELANRLPPNPTRVGSAQQIDPMDPSTLAEMSDSDLAALPASVLDRLAAG